MEASIIIIASLVFGFLVAWSHSISQSLPFVEKGTWKRLLLESASLVLPTVGAAVLLISVLLMV